LFGVSRQGFYQAQRRADLKEVKLQEAKQMVLALRMKMPRLGTRKLYYLLKEDFQRQDIKIGRDGLFSLLSREKMLIKPKKNYTKTTYSKHWLKKYPNLYSNRKANRNEEFFVSDITFIKSRERTHYLSLVTDAFSRKIMGYHTSDDMSAESVVKALKMALKQRITTKPLIHHSDRGLQYCSSLYQEELRKNNVVPSMTDGYDCYQNALAERINGILKNEFLFNKCNNLNELQKSIQQSIDIYNGERPHTSLGYKTPNYVHEKTGEINPPVISNLQP